MELASSSEIRKVIAMYREVVSSNTLEPFLKVFVIGDLGAGKSTLIQALCKDFPTIAKIIPKAMRRVTSRHQPCTAGIIPHMFTSTRLGSILLYDFSGHDEYYTCHSAVLHHSIAHSSPVFLLLVKITDKMEAIENIVAKWLNFIRHYSSKVIKESKAPTPPQLVIVASHIDRLTLTAELQSKQEKIVDAVAKDVPVGSLGKRMYYKSCRIVFFGLQRHCINWHSRIVWTTARMQASQFTE